MKMLSLIIFEQYAKLLYQPPQYDHRQKYLQGFLHNKYQSSFALPSM